MTLFPVTGNIFVTPHPEMMWMHRPDSQHFLLMCFDKLIPENICQKAWAQWEAYAKHIDMLDKLKEQRQVAKSASQRVPKQKALPRAAANRDLTGSFTSYSGFWQCYNGKAHFINDNPHNCPEVQCLLDALLDTIRWEMVPKYLVFLSAMTRHWRHLKIF